jgi:hypothetical protein
MARSPRGRKPKAPPATHPLDNVGATQLDRPVFGQPAPTPDPAQFEVKHPSDGPIYKQIDALNQAHKLAPLPFPAPRGLPEPRLSLADVLNIQQADLENQIKANKQLVFHSTGDTGNTRGPTDQNLVADKLVSDFSDYDPQDRPLFFFHLGDVIYSFGEAQYYYDQFYEPYRNYPAPIIALAGNHDGMVAPGTKVATLAAFLENFCVVPPHFHVTPEAGGLSRTAQIQPGVFFTFEAPMVRILALYSNTLEDPGVIADSDIGDSQIKYLEAALKRVKSESFDGALILAHHHPAYTAGSQHEHGYARADRQGLQRCRRMASRGAVGACAQLSAFYPAPWQDADSLYYLRQRRSRPGEAPPKGDKRAANTGAKTPDDFVTVDLAKRQLVHFTGE